CPHTRPSPRSAPVPYTTLFRSLVEPLSRTLDEVKKEMTTAEKERSNAHTALTERVQAMRSDSQHLRQETSQLVSALRAPQVRGRSEEHTSELQSRFDLVCRLLL